VKESPILPSLFVSHGAPTLPLTDAPARTFLAGLGAEIDRRYGRPKAILVASAHWETGSPAVNAPEVLDTIHDFRGFPSALYDMHYPARVLPLWRPASAACCTRPGWTATSTGDAGWTTAPGCR
jgi:aromatic ring-opening dioxygenase catalytic subunit (LigB family)